MRAVVYIAAGNPEMVRQFAQSVRSLRQCGFAGPVMVLSDLAPNTITWPTDVRYQLVPLKDAAAPFGEKSRLFRRLSPFDLDAAFFVDNDTLFVADPSPVFTLHGDVLWRASRDKTTGRKIKDFKLKDMAYPALHQPEQVATTLAEVPPDFPYYHAGACLFRFTAQAAKFFASFELEMGRFGMGGIEEWALVRGAFHSGITPGFLPEKYNALATWYRSRADARSRGAVMLHFYGIAKKRLYDFP